MCNAHYRDGYSLSNIRLDHSVNKPGIGEPIGLTDQGTSWGLLGQNGGSTGRSVKGVSEEGLRDSTQDTNSVLTKEGSKTCEGDEIRTSEVNQSIGQGDSHSKTSKSCAIYNQVGNATDLISRSVEDYSSKLSCDQNWNISGCDWKQFESEGLDYAEESSSGSCWLSYHPEDEEGPEWKGLCDKSRGILGNSENNEIGKVHIDATGAVLGQGDTTEVKSEVGVMASLRRFLSPKKSSKEPKEPKEKSLQKSSKSLLRVNSGPKSAGSSSNPVLLGISKRENGSDVPSPSSHGGVAVSYGKSPDIKSPGVGVNPSGSSLVNGKTRQQSTGGAVKVGSKSSPTKSTADKKPGPFSPFSRGDTTRRSAREQTAAEKASEAQGFKRNDPTRRSLPVRSLSMSAVTKPSSTVKLHSKDVVSVSDKENKAIGETKMGSSVPDLKKNEDDDQIWVKRESQLFDNVENESQEGNKAKREIHVSSKTAQNVREGKSSEPKLAGPWKLSGPSEASGTVQVKHHVAASADNLAAPPKAQRRIGRVQSHYHVRGNKSQSESDANIWRTTSHQEVSTSPHALDKRSSFDSSVSVFSEPDNERPHSIDLDSELSDASEILSSRCSLNSEVGIPHPNPKPPGEKTRSTSSSNLSRSVSSTDRPQRHSYSNEPDASNLSRSVSSTDRPQRHSYSNEPDASNLSRSVSSTDRPQRHSYSNEPDASNLSRSVSSTDRPQRHSYSNEPDASNLSRSVSSTDRPQRHSYSNEPDAKFRPSVFDRLSMPRKNKMLVASSAPRLHETGVSRSKSLAGSRGKLAGSQGKLAGSQGKLAGSQGKLAKSDSATKVSAGTHRALSAAKDSGKSSGSDGEKPSLSRSSSSSSIPSQASKEQNTTSTRLSKSNSTSKLSNSASKLSSSPLKPSARGGRPFSPEPKKPAGHRPFSPDSDRQKTRARPFSPEPKEQKKSTSRPFSPGARPLSPEPKKERGRAFSPEPKKEIGFGRAFSPEPGKTPARAFSPEPKKPTRSRPFSPEPKTTRALSPEPAKPKVYRSASSVQTSAREKVKRGKDEENSGPGSQGLQRSASSASARQPFVGNTVQKSTSHHSLRDAFQEKKNETPPSQREVPSKKASAKQKLAQELLESHDGQASESDSEIMQYTMGVQPKLHQVEQKVQPSLDRSRPVQRSASDSALLLPKAPPSKSIGAESVPFVPGAHNTPIIGGHLNRNRGHHGIPQDVDKLHSQIMEVRRHLQIQQARRMTDRMIRGRVVNSIPEDIRESECEESEAAAMFESSSAAVNLVKNLGASEKGEIDESFRRNSDNVSDNLENVRRIKDNGQSPSIRPISAPDVSMSVKDDVVDTAERGPPEEANTEPERKGSRDADASSSASASASDDGGSIRKDSLETEKNSKVLPKENTEVDKYVGSNWILMSKKSTEENDDPNSSAGVRKNSLEEVKPDPLVISLGALRRNSLEEKKQAKSRFPLQKRMPTFSKENSEIQETKNSAKIGDTEPTEDHLRKVGLVSTSDSDRSHGVRLRRKSSEWSQDKLSENSDLRTSSQRNADKPSMEVSIEDFVSNSGNTGGNFQRQGAEFFRNRMRKNSIESVKDDVSVKTADVDADTAPAAKTSYVKMRHSTPRKTTWSAINKRLSDPNSDYQNRHSDPNLGSKTWLESPPTSDPAAPLPEPEEAKHQRISLIDSFYLERRLVSPHTTSLQKLFGSSSQIDSGSGSETNLSVLSTGLNPRTNALKRDADSLSPDTMSVASTGSSRVCSPVSDKSGQMSTSSKESTKSSSSGGKREPLSHHGDFVAEVYPASPLVSPVKPNTSAMSGHAALSPEKTQGPPPVPAHLNLTFPASRNTSLGESGSPLKPPPVPLHSSLETSPALPAHRNAQETPPRKLTVTKSPKKQAPPVPSHRNNPTEISPSNPTYQKQAAPPIPSHQNRSNEEYPPFRKRDVAPIVPPHISAQLANSRDLDIGTYDRALPPPPLPPHRSSSLDQSNEPVVSPPKAVPHYDEPPPLQAQRKIFFGGGRKTQQAYGGESSEEEEGNDTISSLAAMDWQTAVTHLQRNRSKSLPADVLQDQAEKLQQTLQKEKMRLEVPEDRLETFEAMRNDISPQRPKIGRRWSVQNSSMQDLLYGPDRDKSRDALDSVEVSPPRQEGRKHSASTQDLHSLDAQSLHRQYAAVALSPLQNQQDMSVSTPSVHQLSGVRPKQSPQSVFEESFTKLETTNPEDQNTMATPKSRSGSIKSAFSTGFLNTLHRSGSSAKSSSKHGSSKKMDKSTSESIKSVESSGRKLPGFLNKILSRKRSSKKDKVDKYGYKRKDSSDLDPDADAEDEPDDENEITIVSPVREELVIERKQESEDDDTEILAQELETDSPNDTLREDRTITESSPQMANRGSFIKEENGLLFFSFMNPARVSPVSTVSSELQVETSKSDKTHDTTSDSYDSGSEASVADSLGNRFQRVGLGAHEPIKLLKEIGESKESLSSAATASGSDSENPFKTRVKLSRTESFRMPRRPKPEPDEKFVRGGVYRGSMPVVRRTPPGSKISPKKDVSISSVSQDEKRTGIIPRALDLNFIRSTLAQRTTENSSIPGSDNLDSGAKQQLSSKSFKLSKQAPSERKLKRANTFTPEEVAKVAHHIQGMAKYSHHGAQKYGGQDAERYDRDVQKQKASTIKYRSASVRGTSDLELPRPKSDFLPGQRTGEKNSMRHIQRQRPKSDLGGAKVIGLAMNKQEWRTQLMTQRSFNRQFSDLGADDESSMARGKIRRMSMPHPIKIRKARSKLPSLTRQKSVTLKRSHSAPDNLNIMRRARSTTSLADSVGNSDDAYETMSLASRRSSQSTISPIDDILEDACTFAEALWDHVTLDVDELGFRAGDVIEVTDMIDKDWWWGRIEDSEGWFPSTFVRLRVNQTDTADDIALKMRDGSIDTSIAMQRVTSGFISKDQARTNVINEIITVERIYVRHLLDVIEGYVKHARKRPEMFSKDRVATIFGNLEEVYTFGSKFLQSLESHICEEAPFLSEIGQCFLDFKQGFEIYSEYCNNHPYGLCELQMLRCDPKYTQFFEACRLLQEMNDIPLEGFLLTPVQKVCKYPLQLAELLKHTRPEHPDYKKVNEALEAMKGIASLINERKRRMESMEKIAFWQTTVEGWQDADLLDLSSELIHTGELHKYSLNTNGWMKDRVFFLFDHQLVYCKRDLLKRDGLTYKGRMVMDCSDILSIPDGRDTQFNLNVKNAWKVFDRRRDKLFLLSAKTAEDKTKWLNAFRRERKRVKEDRHSGFAFSEQTKRIAQQSVKYRLQRTSDPKVRKLSRGNINNVNQNSSTVIPPSSTLTRDSVSFSKKRPWAIFSGKKTTR
ncbi:uncharacterized protein LOC135495173 [Lineus longissimus]|uniref:uncharacterized protein LOC135495173 n=1 Tax=Lineus longissimus TaxID=88925 RepID=UPI00315C8172